MNLSRGQSSELLFIGFNQDHGCYAVGTDSGFRIYNSDPFKETFRREFHGGHGGIGVVEMLFRCNILALVGGGTNPRYPPSKVMIWDDHQSRCIGELSFKNEVKAVRLRRDRIVVVLEQRIYVYNFSDLKLLDQIDTFANPKGLCALCPTSTNIALACPGLHKGDVCVRLYDNANPTWIKAHEGALSALALNLDGTRLATASDKGTLIRLFDTATAAPLQELRRGAQSAEIYHIAFNASSTMVCTTSSSGTVHVFSIAPVPDADLRPTSSGGGRPGSSGGAPGPSSPEVSNQKSALSFFAPVLPSYFKSEWSFARFHIPDKGYGDPRAICAFGADRNTVVVVCADGTYYKCSFDPVKGGDMRQEVICRFVASPSDPVGITH